MAVLKFTVILSLFTLALSCSPPMGWESKPMLERVKESKLMVYGQVSTTSKTGNNVEYTVNVLCVMRKDGISQNIGSSVIIHDHDPTPACVSNKSWMTKDNKIIVMLRKYENKFYFHNINVQSAVLAGNETNLQAIAKSCFVNDDLSGSQCPKVDKKQACNTSSPSLGFAMELLVVSIVLAFAANKMF